MIHVCYALTDKKGTYAKFVATSVCSLLENATASVTVHILHDDTLTPKNRERFIALVNHYRQTLFFYDVGAAFTPVWRELDVLLPMAKHSRVSIATYFRLILAEALPGDIDRLIYLDADTIVNLDISELWRENVGECGLAAVPDIVFSRVRDTSHKLALCEQGIVPRERYFNAGVLLIDMKKWRTHRNLLARGVELLLNKSNLLLLQDQDILNYFFAEDYNLLPDKYNTLVNYEVVTCNNDISPKIYHYLGNYYHLNPQNTFDWLFWQYFMKTPWSDRDFWSRFTAGVISEQNSRELAIIKGSGKRLVVVGMPEDEEHLSKLLSLPAGGRFVPFTQNNLALDMGDNELWIFCLKKSVYQTIFSFLTKVTSKKEYADFIDGHKLLKYGCRKYGSEYEILRDA